MIMCCCLRTAWSNIYEPCRTGLLTQPLLLQHWGGISAVALCPSTNDVYTGSRDCRIKRWSSHVKAERATASRTNGSTAPAPPSASTNGSATPLRCIGDLPSHTGWVTALLATPDVLVSASYDTSVRIWSARDCRNLASLSDVHDDYVTRLAAAPQAGKFVSAGLRGHLHFWDLEALQSVALAAPNGDGVPEDIESRAHRTPEGSCVNSGSIYALHCTPDGRLYAFNGPEGCAAGLPTHTVQLCRFTWSICYWLAFGIHVLLLLQPLMPELQERSKIGDPLVLLLFHGYTHTILYDTYISH